MFGKRPPGGKDLLGRRVRALGARSDASDGAASNQPPARAKARAKRDAMFKNATLTLPDGARIVVVIKDITATGARVEFFARTELPDKVLLSEPSLKLKRPAHVVWQDGGAAGLQFADTP
jgi:hypothetical protein